MIHRAELPVMYGIFIILTSLEESTKYVNFSTEEAGTSVPVTHRYEVYTVAESSEVYNYLPIMGSSVGGLVLLALITAALYKLGFFKRKYKQMMKGAVKDEGSGPTQSAATGHLPTSDDPKQ